jgi:hypothetical protein
VALLVFLWDFGTVTNIWHYLFSYWNLIMFRHYGIICLSIGLWNCSDNVAFLVFLCDFETVPTIWHYLFFYCILEVLPQCGIICFKFQGPIEKPIMPQCLTSSNVQ